jgi:predicted MFS family arabinose efflux permease
MGWTWLLLALAGVVLLALLPLLVFRPAAVIRKRPRSKSVSFKDIGSFFRQKGIWPHLATIGIFQSSLVGIMTMVKPLMIDMGHTAKDIGLVTGICGTATGALMALLAGYLMKRTSRRKAALTFATVNMMPVLYFIFMHPATGNLWVVATGITMTWGAFAMGMVLVFTLAMDNVRHCREGTDFTMQIVVVHLVSLAVSVASGQVAGAFSYATLFGMSLALALLTLVVAWGRGGDWGTEGGRD